MHFESSLSPRRRRTFVCCTLAFNTKTRVEQKAKGENKVLWQTPPADPYSVFLFLPSKTELVKISAAGAKASLHWHRFKKRKKKCRRDKSPQGVLALCTVSCHSPPLCLGLGEGGGGAGVGPEKRCCHPWRHIQSI